MANIYNNFELVNHNFIGYFNPEDCSVDRFKPWIKFLNEQNICSTAITSNVQIKYGPLKLICTTAMVAKDERSFSFKINDVTYTVDQTVFNAALNLPTENFEESPTNDELV